MNCKCGCGAETELSKYSDKRSGSIKGQPLRFLRGHNSKVVGQHPNAKGGKTTTYHGYIQVHRPEHPNSDSKGYVMEHRIVYEGVLGRFLSAKEVIHHLNRVRTDNRSENLFLCRDQRHHTEVHASENALKDCGNAEYRWCPYCKRYDDRANLTRKKSGQGYYHKNCAVRKD